MNFFEQLDKNNLHHAYLVEGNRDEILPELLKFIKSFGAGSECVNITLDSFKIDDARNLKTFASEKSFSDKNRFFIISANSFLLEAQNTLLKIFEEPAERTHFFLIVPDINALLDTLISRFYVISGKTKSKGETKEAEEFIKMPLAARLDFLKELLPKKDEEDAAEEDLVAESSHSRALKFLNALETVLHSKMSKMPFDIRCFEQIFKVRKYLRQPGSSAKTLMESVALIIPEKI